MFQRFPKKPFLKINGLDVDFEITIEDLKQIIPKKSFIMKINK